MKSKPKTERLILSSRTKEEKIAITLEYLASFIVWTERLTKEELISLNSKVKSLIHTSNTENLNKILESCSDYLAEEINQEDP